MKKFKNLSSSLVYENHELQTRKDKGKERIPSS